MKPAPTPMLNVSLWSLGSGNWPVCANAGVALSSTIAATVDFSMASPLGFASDINSSQQFGKRAWKELAQNLCSISLAGVGREIFVVLAFLALVLVGIGGGLVVFPRDVGP